MAISLLNIQNVLHTEDVEGLLALGAPDDEYSSEAQAIADALLSVQSRKHTEADIAAVIERVWNKYFGPFSSQEISKRIPAFQRIARQLVA